MDITNVGGTLTGGSTVALASSGMSSQGKASYATPDHTRVEPRTVDFLVKQATTTANSPGVARSGIKIAFANRLEVEGCCDVKAGTVIIDVDVRWPLSQPETLVDDALSYLRALVHTTAFSDAVKKGILPG